MRVRISVVHLRILMLFVNLALAVGFAVYYVRGLLSPGRSTRSVAIVEAEKFRNVRNVGLQGTDPSPVVSTAAQYMLPPEPREPTPVVVDKETEEAVDEEPEEEPTEGGPLAEEWEYVWGIYDQDQPKNSLVMLRKKEDTGTRRTSIGSRTGRRFSTRNRRAAAARRLRRRQVQNADDLITFQVKDRHYVDEDKGIDIWIHEATAEELVYSEDQDGLPGRPFYALKRTFTTQYEEKGTTESLWELAPEEDEEAGEDEEEKEKSFIVRDSHKYEDLREMQYQKALEGEKFRGKAVTPRRRRIIGAGSSGAQADGNVTPARPARPPSTPAGSRASSRSRTAGGRITDPDERRKQMQQFEEAVEELPAEAQQEIKEALVNPPREGN